MKRMLMLIPLVVLILSGPGFSFPAGGEKPETEKKFQLSLDGGPIDYPRYSGAVSLAFRTSERWFWGFRLGFVWEDNLNTFKDTKIWEAFHADLFRRFVPCDYLLVDLGGSILAHAARDDSSDVGTFVGAYGSLSLGYQVLFVSPVIRMGWTSKDGLGIIFSPFIIKLQFRF
jgi:hypothetical protein